MTDWLQNENSRARARYWVFTLNNYTQEDIFYLANLPYDDSNPIGYIAFAQEVAPQTGTHHLQGHLELTTQLRFSQLKQLVSPRAYLACRRGSFSDSETYISKEGEVFRSGSRLSKGSGSRSDLEECRALLDSGGIQLVAQECFASFVRYHKGFEKYLSLQQISRTWPTEVIVYWGKTGTGKTRKVYDENENIYAHTESQWFDGYTGQSVVLFDDFHGGVFKLPYLLKLLDRYPMLVPVKGGFVSWTPKKLYITSNIDPRSWYMNANTEHVAALFRRISKIVHFDTFP